ncbi:adhesin HecA family 20-residue repeat-containing protein [Streptomyces zhaozhouensis]|uniref:Adhesin HecA family 20-residue repeat-containing protein n=1 Tax=Streptomyces zhaozhouensis TaxID=1300267 RepID=A0A286E7Z1_9ACTN|nr:hypothetical protein [Streptomyces zhaozhouensis]SOD67037.1 adhesin HecA family 20-residue repeat-containing protein [Streptomyces zhaozhouensis]
MLDIDSLARSPYLPSLVVAQQRAMWERQLLAYLNSSLPPWDWRRADQLADRVWARVEAAGAVDLAAGAGLDNASGLPAYLAAAARTTLREHLHPAPGLTPERVPTRRNPYPTTPAGAVVGGSAVRLADWEQALLNQHGVTDHSPGLPAAA